MATTAPPGKNPKKAQPAPASRAAQARRRQRRKLLVRVGAISVVALAGLYLLAQTAGGGGSGSASGGPPFAVGQPGPGAQAPPIRLVSTAGGSFDLAAQRGKTVLVYFQEGLGCQPCWDQVRDIEKDWGQFAALGIDSFVSIAGNPLEQLRQKAQDEGITTPVLADPELSLGMTSAPVRRARWRSTMSSPSAPAQVAAARRWATSTTAPTAPRATATWPRVAQPSAAPPVSRATATGRRQASMANASRPATARSGVRWREGATGPATPAVATSQAAVAARKATSSPARRTGHPGAGVLIDDASGGERAGNHGQAGEEQPADGAA